MKITIGTGSYNELRYGKPYIGKINPADGKVTSWGTWIGTPGSTGILEIEANEGDILIKGQKDNRGNNKTPEYAVVQAGEISYMGKAEAVKSARQIAAQAKDTTPNNNFGNIEFQPESTMTDGGTYTIWSPIGQGWGIPTKNITPADLRAMADHLEAQRKSTN